MKLIYILFIIVAVFFLMIWLRSSGDENFKYSTGGFSISWAPPLNSGEDVTYNIVIRDDNNNIVDSQTGLKSPRYFFRDGDWNTHYNVSVSVTNPIGTGPPSVIDFTSPQGYYSPSNIQNLQVLGRNNNSNQWENPTDGFSSIETGNEITAFSINFDQPPSSAPKFSNISGSSDYNPKTSVIAYSMVVYVPKNSNTLEECCITTKGPIPRYGATPIYSHDDGSQWQIPLTTTDANGQYCDAAKNYSVRSEGESCRCPIKIGMGDAIVAVLVFLQPYSGAVTGMTKLQKYGLEIPDAPISVSYSWEPIQGHSAYPDQGDIKEFIFNHSDVAKVVAQHQFRKCSPDCSGKSCGDSDGCGGQCTNGCPVSCSTSDDCDSPSPGHYTSYCSSGSCVDCQTKCNNMRTDQVGDLTDGTCDSNGNCLCGDGPACTDGYACRSYNGQYSCQWAY